jgi:hypothetical protein
MPYTMIHDGLMREFDFWAPEGWEYWLYRRWVDEGRLGLPLVIALHGGGQSPEEFQEAWPFTQVWAVDDEDDMRRLLTWGADALITNRPDVAVRVRDGIKGHTGLSST